MIKMKLSKSKLLFLTGALCISISMIIALPGLYFSAQNSAYANQKQPFIASPKQPSVSSVSGTPVSLSLPSLGLSLVVTDGVYNQRTGAWTLSNDKAHYAQISPPANNESGNTIIYGHYRPEVFASLKKIKLGEQVAIRTDNGYVFNYRFVSTKSVKPNDTSIFSYQGEPILTIQTCSGAWMQNRQLYSFEFIDYQKI